MTPLTANLKTLYQCRFLWLFHIILLSGIITMTAVIYKLGTPDPPYITIPLLMIFYYGGVIGFLVSDLVSKPFAFTLPDRTKAAQNMFLLVWLSIIAITILMMLALDFFGIKSDYAQLLASIGIMSLSYWLGTVIIVPKKGFITVLVFILLVPMTLYSAVFKIKFIEPVLIAHPWISIFICGIIIYPLYRALGKREHFRHLCATAWAGFSIYNAAKRKNIRREQLRSNPYKRLGSTPQWLNNFFTDRISSDCYSALSANMWGQIYLIIGPFFIGWKGILTACLSLYIYFFLPAFLSSDTFAFVVRVAIFIFVSLFFSIPFSPGGCRRFNLFMIINRREHFWRGIVALSVIILVTIGYMTIFVLLFKLLTQNIIPIVWGDKSIIPYEWILLIVPIITIPLFGGLLILFKKTALIVSMSGMFFIALTIICGTITLMAGMSFFPGALIFLAAMAITWGFYSVILYYDCMKRPLC
jgi:hypothetical protein